MGDGGFEENFERIVGAHWCVVRKDTDLGFFPEGKSPTVRKREIQDF